MSFVGGGSYCLLNILKELDRTKYKPLVLLKQQGPLTVELNKLDIDVYTLPTMHIVPYNESTLTFGKILSAIAIICSLRQFRKLIQKLSPDLVYINTMMLYPYLRIAKEEGFKTIIHIREHWPEGEHKIQRKIAINYIIKYADQLIAINSFSASMFYNAPQPIEIVYDWINLSDRFEYMPFDDILGEDSSTLKVFLFMGGLQPIKGTLEVLSTFKNHLTNDNYRLIVMGIVPHQLSKGIKGIIKVILSRLGYKTYSSKVMALINADNRIKCIPSVYSIKHILEQTYCILSYFKIPHANLALAEGIVTKTLTVAASTPESIEYSHNGELAILFQINNREDFISKLDSLDSRYEEMKALMVKDCHFIEEMFDRRVNAKKLDMVYDHLLY